jgi:hypothetical protein
MIALLICSATVSGATSSSISKERFLQKKVMSMKGSDAEVVYKKHHGNHTKPEESIGLTEKKKHKKHKGAETKADTPTKKNHHKKHNPTNETETNSIEEPGIIEKEHHMTTHQKNHTKAIDKDTILIEKVAEKDGLKVKEILHKHGPKNSIAEMIMHEKEAETRASSSNVVESVVAEATAQKAEVEADSIEIVMAQQQSMVSSAKTTSIWISCMVGLVSMMC